MRHGWAWTCQAHQPHHSQTFPTGFDGTQENPAGYFWDAQSPVPLVTHLHGAVVQSDSDGGPEQWFTADGKHGVDYRTTKPTTPNAAVYFYPNDQEPTTLFYHDHALGMTRLNVASGLAGFWKIEERCDPIAYKLPSGKYDIPLAIQDRTFNDRWLNVVPNRRRKPRRSPILDARILRQHHNG